MVDKDMIYMERKGQCVDSEPRQAVMSGEIS
jgi:hypothetical protein